MTSHDDVRKEIITWNVRFPYDRLWRKKYNIPFNSTEHREICFLDQRFDIEEDKFFEELISSEQYTPNVGDWLKTPEVSQENLEDSIKSFREEFKHLEQDE